MSEVRVTEKHVGDIAILEIKGRFRLGDEPVLQKRVAALVEKGILNILFDIRVKEIDQAGLLEIHCCYVGLEKAGGRFGVIGNGGPVADLMRIVKFTQLFEIFDDSQTAIEALGAT